MNTVPRGYDALVRALRWSAPLLERGESKLAQGIRGRRDARQRLEGWASSARDAMRPLVWAHAPSVGEGLQARAILDALTEVRPGIQLAYTHFSPSAEGLARKMPVDVATYFPWDVRGEMDAVIGALRPDLVAFTKTEVWPGLTAAAVDRGVPVLLTAATLPERAGRLRLPARQFLNRTFGALQGVLAIAEADGRRFHVLGVPEDRITVTGDPGIDSAWQRAQAADPDASYLAPFRGDERVTLVAGSTWGADESVLIPALAAVRQRFPRLRMVIAPHEPTKPHLAKLEEKLARHDFESRRLARVEEDGEAGPAEVVVVDRVGVLAHLYTVGDIAYVGGGFGNDGLHSVLEPAAARLPVVFGPRHGNARAAAELVEAGAGRSVADGRELASVLGSWVEDRGARTAAGTRGSDYIDGHRGAARRTAETLTDHLSTSQGARR